MKTILPTLRSGRAAVLLAAALLLAGGAARADSKPDTHGYLGVTLQDINGSMAKALGIDEGVGVLVLDVIEDGPAEQAGIEAGDVILKFDGEDITEDHGLTRAVRGAEPGRTVPVEILRNGKSRTVDVELGETEALARAFAWTSRDGKAPEMRFFGEGDDHDVWFHDGSGHGVHVAPFGLHVDRGYLGVELGDLNEQLGEYFGVEDGDGALINAVEDDSPAAAAGLQAGDVIVGIGDETIADSGDVYDALEDLDTEDEVTVTFVRKGRQESAEVTLGEMPEGHYRFRVGRVPAPPVGGRFGHDWDFVFPEGFDEDVHVVVPQGSHPRRRVIVTGDKEEQVRELREELETMKQELQELKKELRK
jgi:serine protease Do